MKNTYLAPFFLNLALLFLSMGDLHGANSKFDIEAGYRQDHFVWELGGQEGGPPVLSRLSWKDLRIFDVAASFKKIDCRNVYYRVWGDYGRIFHGKNRDSDYRVNQGRIEEYSRFDNNGGKGDVWDITGGFGYFLRTDICALRIVPLLGYSAHEQNLHMYDGYLSQMLDIPNFPGHHFNKLHSTYRARWYGPWSGVDMYYHCTDRISLVSYLEYHWLRYRARGHWNLRDDFAGSFHHTGDGQGILGTLGIDYNFLNGCYLGVRGSYNYFFVTKGRDRTPVYVMPSEGSDPIIMVFEGELKKVKWHSFSILFNLGYNF
jgi:hypothetical protein